MKTIRRIALMAGSLSIMAALGSPCALAQSGDAHTNDEIAAQDEAAGGQGHTDGTSLSEADWLKKAGLEQGGDAVRRDHGDAGHGDHDGHHDVAAAQPDDSRPDEGALNKGDQQVMSEEDWMKAPVDDHHSGDDHHDGEGEHEHTHN